MAARREANIPRPTSEVECARICGYEYLAESMIIDS